MYKRSLDLNAFKQSFFLFGPRQVGKTFLIKNTLPTDLYIDLLKHNEFVRYSHDPSFLSKEVAALGDNACRIVIDEIQRCPELLNEVQLIMEEGNKRQFILTGSSARKLRRAGVNLLGGRALTLHLYPLTHEELGRDFDLAEVLRFGSIPSVVLEQERLDKVRRLNSYAETYLKEEIQQEAITRNVPAFAKFLELAAHENGNLLNFQSLAQETGVHSKTIKEYFNILEDTLLGFRLLPFHKSPRTKVVAHPKFYFFDTGVTAALRGEASSELSAGTAPFGRAFEHFIILEALRLGNYRERPATMSFFRTTDGAEVDLILERGEEIWAVEIKASGNPNLSAVRGLRSFIKDHKYHRAICVCLTPRPFQDGGIEFLPWIDFLRQV